MNKVKVLYLHGLGSVGNSSTTKMLSDNGFEVVSPTYNPHCYESSMKLIKSLKNKDFDLIVGTSFGGYWATTLSSMTFVPCIVFNPVLEPSRNLQKYVEVGGLKNYKTGEFISITKEEVSKFHNIDSSLLSNKEKAPFTIVSGTKDNLVPHDYVKGFCKNNGVNFVSIQGMGHRVDERILPILKQYPNLKEGVFY